MTTPKCSHCGKTDERTLSGLKLCMTCAASQSKAVRKHYRKRRDEKRCTRCGAQDKRTLNGMCQCRECAIAFSRKCKKKKTAQKEGEEAQ